MPTHTKKPADAEEREGEEAPPDDLPPSMTENAPPPVGMEPDLIPLHWLGGHAEYQNMINPDGPPDPDPPSPPDPPAPPEPEPEPEPKPA